MENNNTSFDKIMQEFSSNVQHLVPRMLSFDQINKSSTPSVSKKRKLSAEESPKNDNNSSFENMNSTILSPWTTKLLRADLLEANSRITKLKKEIQSLELLKSSMEAMYTEKVSALQQQCDFSANKHVELEKHLQIVKKRENTTKNELVKLNNQLNNGRQLYEEKIFELNKHNSEIENENRILKHKYSNEVSEYKRKTEKLLADLELATRELDACNEKNLEYKEKSSLYDKLLLQLETEKQEHEIAKTKIKSLEYEIVSYGEWKDMEKSCTSRLTNLPDLEKEILRLRQDNKNIRDALGNKLLLEEQVFDLENRLEKYEEIKNEAINLKVELNSVEEQLKEWQAIAKDHCQTNGPLTPAELRCRIEELLQKELVLSSEKDTTKSEKNSIKVKLNEIQTSNEVYIKKINDLNNTMQQYKVIISRLQKKLFLVANERDCFKQLVDSFEKDMTISGQFHELSNVDSQAKARIEVLEKTLARYKEMYNNLEKEIAPLKSLPDALMQFSSNSEYVEKLNKELDEVRTEKNYFQTKVNELQLDLERINLKRSLDGKFSSNSEYVERLNQELDEVRTERNYLEAKVNELQLDLEQIRSFNNFKVLHFEKNPAAEAHQNTKFEIEKLQAEIDRLKRKIVKLEEENTEITSRLNHSTNDTTIHIAETNILREKVTKLEDKLQSMRELYSNASLEFREVCYMLFGYRVDRVTNTNYRISSLYAESSSDYLNFRLNESGILDMLETRYSSELTEMMKQYLTIHKSLPAFLATLTIDLFNRSTMVTNN